MEQLNATVRVGLFVRKLGPRKVAMENEPSSTEDQLKPLDGLEGEHLEEVGTLGVIKGFSVGVNEQGQEVVCIPIGHNCLCGRSVSPCASSLRRQPTDSFSHAIVTQPLHAIAGSGL